MESDQGQLLKDITSFLEKNKIPYMITGAWSVIFYGRPRASHDIDFVVEIHEHDIDRIIKIFNTLSQEFLIQQDLIKDAILEKKMFNILHLSSMLKLDFWILQDDEFNKLRFSRKKKEKILNQNMHIASPEDTILKKLLWYEESKIEKHIVDAAFVYQIQKENLDKKYLIKWAKKQKTTKLLKELSTIDLEKHY
ncbi:nucleotidyl transferase AbiEii/AbiGii toxin family protein [Patescibacteria group bacterium]|nr:nucleotidyl transferase AbiEii/AbiGii toxin family protein [Patescibacteria group bacterium]MBU4016958.1 nucleotidyl transferase AbiEii/AbiGii toxin family protein [Patescibacteria group bacterium]MBU4098439.1 nucleotidyl transferase AbiEii/AbiGii toxin family protein [Patescibacteria group bacterium]